MRSKVNRRGFLKRSASAVAAGAAATAARVAKGAPKAPAPPGLPLPDAGTKVAPGSAAPQPVCCAPAATLIFACSGSADVGKICDQAARRLSEIGAGKMSCLAGVGGRVQGIMDAVRSARTILVLDGCPMQCARNTMNQAGFKKFNYVCLSDLGLVKGKTPVTETVLAQVVGRGKNLLPK